MIWKRSLYALIPRNPIILREINYQQWNKSFYERFAESVGVVIVALAFTIAMLVCVVNGLNPQKYGEYLMPIQLLAWIFHTLAVLRMITAGTFSVLRYRGVLNTDDVMLTPLTNWQLLFGNWWAAMHQMRGWMVALGIVQLGIVASTGFGLSMTFSWSMTCGNPCTYIIGELYRGVWSMPIPSLFIGTAAIGIAILETAGCTALGILLGILVRSNLGLIYATVLRFVPVFIFSFFPDYPWAWNGLLRRYEQYTWFSFADGGTGALIELANSVVGSLRGILGVWAISGMLLLYSSLSLLIAWAVMRRSRY